MRDPMNMTRCPDCGKVRLMTRSQAKRLAARHRKQGRGRMSAYRCGEFWHIGHMPQRVISGDITRGEFYGGGGGT